MHIGGNVVGLDLALEQQTIARLACGERVEVRLRHELSARPGHRENAHRGRNFSADRLQVLPDLIAGGRPERHDGFRPGRAHEFGQ
jgi:hypothetical protein